jgi:hypothetical protein
VEETIGEESKREPGAKTAAKSRAGPADASIGRDRRQRRWIYEQYHRSRADLVKYPG